MPELHDVTVNVTDDQGNIFKEWGVQRLGHHNKISAYIKSTTDMPFRVSIQPKIPYIAPHVISANLPSSSRRTRSDSGDESSDRRSEPKQSHKHKDSSFSSPLRPPQPQASPSPPDFDFLASLYVDGRHIPERRTIVYLDPKDPDFTPPDGKSRFKSRWVQGPDGSMKEHAWVFKDVGIEASFGKLLVSKGESTAGDFDEPVEDALIRDLNSAVLNAETGPRERAMGKVGQIVVTLERVQLGRKSFERNYRAKHREGEKDDLDMDGIERDISHATGLTYVGTLPSQPIRVVDYYHYNRGEGPYATFQFFYRSQECLEKFRFIGFPLMPKKPPMKRGKLNMDMVNKIPLSIAYAKQGATKPLKLKGKAYEENVRDKSFGDSVPGFTCKDGYRDVSAIALKERASHSGNQVNMVDPKVSRRNRGRCHNDKVRSYKQDEEIGGHSSASYLKEDENREDHLITPPSTSSAESSYSPPVSMKDHMTTATLAPKQPHAPMDSMLEPMKGNVSTSPLLSVDHRPFMRDDIELLNLPAPNLTVPLIRQDSEAGDKLTTSSRKISDELYRKTARSSDADDEGDDSDLETEVADDGEAQGFVDLDNFCSADKDDKGLHAQLEAVRISPRKRHLEDEEAVNEIEEAIAASGLKEEVVEDLVGGADGALARGRQRRNALSEEEKQAFEESKGAKRVKVATAEARVIT